VVLRSPDRIATLQEAFDGAGELAAVGVEDGEVLQSGVPSGGGTSSPSAELPLVGGSDVLCLRPGSSSPDLNVRQRCSLQA
jgi:hypothetical protein